MDIAWVVLLVIVAAALYFGFVRPRRSKTPEEHLEQATLKAEQDKMRTEAQYQADRYNLRE